MIRMSHQLPDRAPTAEGTAPSDSTKSSLILASSHHERLISDDMGSEIFTIYAGEDDIQQRFTIHKNLLLRAGVFFRKLCADKTKNVGKKVILKHEDPAAFRLFVDYLYSRQVPSISARMSRTSQAERLQLLCKAYAFADKVELNFELRNKFMDKIQDGFVTMGMIPEPGLVKAIYDNTNPDCKLRKFCTESLIFHLRDSGHRDDGLLGKLLREKVDIMEDFLGAVSSFAPGMDPRIRDCEGFDNYAESVEKGYGNEEQGVWPCHFHLHRPADVDINDIKGENESNGTGSGGTTSAQDDHCYLWLS